MSSFINNYHYNLNMPKPEIEFKKEPLKWICNEAFYSVKCISSKLYYSEKYDKKLALGLGALGGIGAAEFGKYVVFPKLVEPIAETLGNSITLDNVISHSIAFTVGVAVTPFIIAPKQTLSWIKENTTYASGVLGVKLGAIATAIYELS